MAMKTLQDTQLEQELQELHLVSSNWISDIRFIQDEIKIFKQLIHKTLSRANDDQLIRVRELNSTRANLEEKISKIQIEIQDHLRKIEPLIRDSDRPIEISLIEEHTQLGNNVADQFRSFSTTKQELFSFVGKVTQSSMATVVN